MGGVDYSFTPKIIDEAHIGNRQQFEWTSTHANGHVASLFYFGAGVRARFWRVPSGRRYGDAHGSTSALLGGNGDLRVKTELLEGSKFMIQESRSDGYAGTLAVFMNEAPVSVSK